MMAGPKLLSFCLVMATHYFLSQACNDVEIVTRDDWSARKPIPYNKLQLPVKHVMIAHTVTPECNDKYSCSARMRSMQNYHMDNRGFPNIGYNYVIGGDGRVYEGTGCCTEGTHTKGFNSISAGIAFIGDFSKKRPSDRMMTAARKLIVCGIQKGYISKDREVHGARDGTCTASPGDALYNLIKTWPRFKGGRLPGYTCPN